MTALDSRTTTLEPRIALSRADASAALADVAAAQTRSETLRGYQSAAPHLIIWGIAWAAGYTATDLAPRWSGLAWLCVCVLAVIADIVVARADRADTGQGAAMGWLFLIFFAFVGATIAIMQPHEPQQVGALIPLVVAASYAVIGVMGMPRLLVLAGLMAALTLAGFFALPAHFLLWMAVIGGGSLVLGGLWLRRA
jgi:hypothetical protein